MASAGTEWKAEALGGGFCSVTNYYLHPLMSKLSLPLDDIHVLTSNNQNFDE